MVRADPGINEGEGPTGQLTLGRNEPLLKTKLFVPPPRPNRVARPRLFEQLNSGLDKALILISAPAGYGKTTLAGSWLRSSNVASSWLSLDEDDNDPIRFLRHFVAALEKVTPIIQPDLLSALQGMRVDPPDVLLNILINEIVERAPSFVYVLDDFHVIHAQPILEMVASLLEHLPPQMHLLLLSRTDPPLPLFRLRARDQLLEIRVEQLRFTADEIAVFLNEAMDLRLSIDDIKTLEARTEGWIASLQLAGLSLRGCKDASTFVAAFAGSHHYIMDYLTEEVLKLQPENVRSFLLQTSILTSMCASLCDAVTLNREPGIAGQGESIRPSFDSQSILEYLEHSNLFVVPLDDKRQWYRYHHLFAEVLTLHLEHLSPPQLPDLHARASHWYEQNGIILEATHHALMAKNRTRAVQLVERNGCSLLMRGEGFTLLKWIEAVESYVQTHPWLAVLKAWAFAMTGRVDEVEPMLQMAEGLISPDEPTSEVKIALGSIAAVRAYVANLHGQAQLAREFAQEALGYLPDGDAFSCSMRSVTVSILGDASWLSADLQGARLAYLEAVRISQATGNVYMTVIANSNLADVLREQGDIHQAAGIYSEALHMATRPDGQVLPLADRLYAGLGHIAYERNQLDSAAQYLRHCVELSQKWGNLSLLATAYVKLAWLERAAGKLENALAAIQAAERMTSVNHVVPGFDSVKVACAHWWLAQGDLERSSRLAEGWGATTGIITEDSAMSYQQEPKYLLDVRLLLAQGDYEAALSLTERLLPMAKATKRMGRVIEILVLEALTWQGKKDMAQALAVLEKALSVARPESFMRTFLDEGEPMAKLLYRAKTHRIVSGYTSELLAAFGGRLGPELLPAQSLIEPLTQRELEVLRLIQAGCSNLDIADKLVISVPTAKRHISNIFAKLGVKSRTQAVSVGTELGLLE